MAARHHRLSETAGDFEDNATIGETASCNSSKPGSQDLKRIMNPTNKTEKTVKSRSLEHPLLAYRNEEFLDTPDARSLRILSEYLYPLSHFRKEKIQDTIVFFGSARTFEMGPNGALLQRSARAGAPHHGVVRSVWTISGAASWSAPAAAPASWKPPIAARRTRAAKPSA